MYSVRNGKVTNENTTLTVRVLALLLNRNQEILGVLRVKSGKDVPANVQYELKQDRNGYHVYSPSGPMKLQEICETLNQQEAEMSGLRAVMSQEISFAIVRKATNA